MKGDFTRLSFRPQKRFGKVLMQQGRVQLDQDWNEQMQILARRWEVQTADMIGQSGVPTDASGFGISYEEGALRIAPGRLYVDGMLVEAFTEDGPLTINQQPYHPGTTWEVPTPGTDRLELIYLKAWERHVSAVEDSSLLEPALRGIETATRSQTAWQVLSIPVQSDAISDPQFRDWQSLTAQPTGRLTNDLAVATEAGAPTLENRLYRVEVHTGGELGMAQFKWSRDNGSVAFRIRAINKNQVVLTELGQDLNTTFTAGQWVEVLDDQHEFREGHGKLVQITRVREYDRTLELSESVETFTGTNRRLRRWDQVGATPLTIGSDWVELEEGIQVQFTRGTYRAGDFWTFASRAETGTIESLVEASPQGAKTAYYQLALLQWQSLTQPEVPETIVELTLNQDRRHHFSPLSQPQMRPDLAAPPYEYVTAGSEPFADRLTAAILRAPEGGVVVIGPGYHVLEHSIKLDGRSRVAIRGVAGATRILFDTTEPVAAFEFQGCAEVELSELTLYGRGTAMLLLANQTTDLHLSNCHLVNLNTEGVAIWSHGGLKNLTLTDCQVLAGATLFSAQEVAGLTIRNSQLQNLRAGLVAQKISGLRFTETILGAPADPTLLSNPAALDADVVKQLELNLTGQTPQTTIHLPVGLLVTDGVDWAIGQSHIAAGLAVVALKLTELRLVESQVDALVGLLTYQSRACTVTGSTITAQPGASILAFGLSQAWQITGNNLSGLPWAIQFGTSEWDYHLLDQLLPAVRLGLNHLLPGADALLAGKEPGYLPSLPDQVGLADQIGTIFTPTLLGETMNQASHGQVDGLQIEQNRTTGIGILRGTTIQLLTIARNVITAGKFIGICVQGTAGTSGLKLITENQIETSGVGIAVETAGFTISQNQIDGNGRVTDRSALLASSDGFKSQSVTLDLGNAITRQVTGDYWLSCLSTAVELHGASEIAAVKPAFDLAQAAFPEGGVEHALLSYAGANLTTEGRAQAVRAIYLWTWLTAGILETPSIYVAASGSTVTSNRVIGHDGAYGGILIDQGTLGSSQTWSEIIINANQLSQLEGYAVSTRNTLQKLRVEENQVVDAGPLFLQEVTGAVVRANQVEIPLAKGIGCYYPEHGCLLLINPSGLIKLSDNQLTGGDWPALLTLGTGAATDLMITGNTMTARHITVPWVAKIDVPQSSVILAQNEFNFTSSNSAGPHAVLLTSDRAAITGNIWKDQNYAKPLALTANSYTVVGNITNKPLNPAPAIPVGEPIYAVVQENVTTKLAFPDDPIISFVDGTPTEISTSTVLQFTAEDRNAPAGDATLGIQHCKVYLDGGAQGGIPLGDATFDPATKKYSITLDPIARNLTYTTHKLYVAATSAFRAGVTKEHQQSFLIKKAYTAQPEGSFTAPAVNSNAYPGKIWLKLTAKDQNASGGNQGIKRVSFSRVISATNTAPIGEASYVSGVWQFEWDATYAPLGPITIAAQIYSNRADEVKSVTHTFNLVAAYPNDPQITINSPSADAYLNGTITFSGSAVDRNSPTQPSAKDVTIRVVQGGSTWWVSPISMDGNNWSATWNSSGLKGAMTVYVTAKSERLNQTREASRNFTVWYPNQPEISITNPAWGSSHSVGSNVLLKGYAADKNSTNGAGISAVHLYRVNDDYSETWLAQAWLNSSTGYWECYWTAATKSTASLAAMAAPETTESETMLTKESASSLKANDGEVIVYVDDDYLPGDDPYDPEPEPDPVYHDKTIKLRVKAVSHNGVWCSADRHLIVYWYA